MEPNGIHFLVRVVLSVAVLFVSLSPLYARAGDEPHVARAQTVYIPSYSYVFFSGKGHTIHLNNTLCVRNLDSKNSITITAVTHYSDQGKPIKHYVSKPIRLLPLASTRFHIDDEVDAAAGFGNSLLVKWGADTEVTTPLVECIMIGVRSSQGISFTTQGRVLEEEHSRVKENP